MPISTGNSQPRRLNRGGDRRANSALWTIVMVRLRSRHASTVAYLQRRVTEGHSKRSHLGDGHPKRRCSDAVLWGSAETLEAYGSSLRT